ncbi:hypothetical protein SEVIR_7G307632v4 [Setaria viridis]
MAMQMQCRPEEKTWQRVLHGRGTVAGSIDCAPPLAAMQSCCCSAGRCTTAAAPPHPHDTPASRQTRLARVLLLQLAAGRARDETNRPNRGGQKHGTGMMRRLVWQPISLGCFWALWPGTRQDGQTPHSNRAASEGRGIDPWDPLRCDIVREGCVSGRGEER